MRARTIQFPKEKRVCEESADASSMTVHVDNLLGVELCADIVPLDAKRFINIRTFYSVDNSDIQPLLRFKRSY